MENERITEILQDTQFWVDMMKYVAKSFFTCLSKLDQIFNMIYFFSDSVLEAVLFPKNNNWWKLFLLQFFYTVKYIYK